MTLVSYGMHGRYHVVGSTSLPPGIVYAWQPAKIARELGLWPYFKPTFDLPRRGRRRPRTDDMRQMLDDIGAPA